MGRACDNAVVGVLVRRAGRLLMIERAGVPKGFAPPAGHVEGHGTAEDAARAELAEETGLTAVSLDVVLERWRGGVCGSRDLPGPRGWGHLWTIFEAEAVGEPSGTAEARSVGWFTPAEVQALADRTVAFADGDVSAAEFAERPGLEPVWLAWLSDLGVIRVSPVDLAAVEVLVADPRASV